jgi:DNA-binding NtrC family response regulator
MSNGAAHRTVRAGQPRHDFPGRDRRGAARAAAQAAARAPGKGIRTPRQLPHDSHRCPSGDRHQRGPPRDGRRDEKKFRAHLYYRLNVFPIRVPALRERPEDVALLVRFFARSCAARMGRKIKWIPSTAMDALVRYSWPENIRELQNLIERAVIRSTGERLDVPVSEIDEGIGTKARGSQGTLEEAERAHILATLKETRWVLSGPLGAARRLGLNRSTLQFRMKKLGNERPALGD